ncbi:MAG: fatty acid CoA ligase family protein [Candidatus Eremiobacteraeota bacterium]|nr:fatty acid CoA ligase family protein [Candidatus Eremiobacteraeota bacterium]
MTPPAIVNVAMHLPEMARQKPHSIAVVCPQGRDGGGRVTYSHLTLKQLNDESDTLAWGIESAGIRRGTRTVLMVSPSLPFFALTFALFKTGAIPVMVDPGIGIKGLGQCLAEAEPSAFIGIPKAQAARLLFKWASSTVKISITVGKRLFWGGFTLKEIRERGLGKGPYRMAETGAGDIAAILFTSGSTGVSKGAVYTHGIFDSQVKYLREIYGIEPGEMDLATFPLFALFGPALGMTAIIPDMDASRPASADAGRLIEAIEDFGATNMFASPALINKVGRYGESRAITLPSLRRVISAGAPARPDALERFSKMLGEGVEIFTPYGATEALPVCNIGSREILGETRKESDEGKGACIGKPVRDITLKIIKITDEPIAAWSETLVSPRGEIGELAVKGPIVTREYYQRPESTRLAKIAEGNGGEFWHRMGDVGYEDERGRIWFCGRKSHRVVTAERTLFTIPCEAIFNAHPAVFRSALVGVKRNGATVPVMCIELEKGTPGEKEGKIREELLARGARYPHTKGITTLLFHPSFPVDIRHNAKIFREKLALWAERTMP